MLGRDWLHFIAAGGCLIVFLTVAGAVLAQGNKSEQQSKAGQTNDANKQPAPQSPAFRVILKWEKPDETNWSKPNCENPQSHDEADLCEQRHLANLSKWQVGIGILTLLGLTFTIVFAYRSAKAAIEAAKHGRTAARATAMAARAALRQTKLAESTARETPHNADGGCGIAAEA
jgi:hypothetical protein